MEDSPYYTDTTLPSDDGFNNMSHEILLLSNFTEEVTLLSRKSLRRSTNGNIYETLSDILVKYVSPAICLFGILGNILTLIILTRRTIQKSMQTMERSSNIGLIALSISDILFCITVLPKAFLHVKKINLSINLTLVYTVYGDAIVNVFITSSTLLTVTMAVQRYLAICYPIKARMIIDYKHTRLIIAFVCLFSLMLNLPRFWKHRIITVDCVSSIIRANCTDDMFFYLRRNAYMKVNKGAKNVFMIVHFVLSVAVPLILLTFCNANLIKALKNSSSLRQKHSNHSFKRGKSKTTKCVESTHRITLTLIVIIILFLILVTPAEITNFVRDFKHTVKSNNIYLNQFITDFVNTLQKMNFAFNFVLYCVINVHFRKTLWDILVCKSFNGHVTHSSETTSRRFTSRSTVKYNSWDMQTIPSTNWDESKGKSNCDVTNESETLVRKHTQSYIQK